MGRKEMASAVRSFMLSHDLTYKEMAERLSRSVTTLQSILAGEKVSERTFARVQLVVIKAVKS